MSYSFRIILSILFVYSSIQITNAQTDIFGITQLYPSKAGFIEWNSNHWNNSVDRTIVYASDASDPTDWTEDHSATSFGFHIFGDGIMKMYGSPRFHIDPTNSSKVTPQVFTNIEFTAYYMKKGSLGSNWGGMIVGMRGSALGHASSGGNVCDAQCYNGRFRNDGKWDFEKELKHPGSTYYSGSGYNTQDLLWGGIKLPENRWIGMKYILRNINNNTQAKMTLYIDSISNGNPIGGGTWELVGEVIDNGSNWQGGDISGCTYTNAYMPILNGGNVYWRTDNDTAYYKYVSIREIETTTTSSYDEIKSPNATFSFSIHQQTLLLTSNESISKVEVYSLTGEKILQSSVNEVSLKGIPSGVYILKATAGHSTYTRKFVY